MKPVPTSDKEIASVYLEQTLRGLILKLTEDVEVSRIEDNDDFDVYAELREIAGKNLRESRLDKIIERIVGRVEKMLVPIDRYLATKK